MKKIEKHENYLKSIEHRVYSRISSTLNTLVSLDLHRSLNKIRFDLISSQLNQHEIDPKRYDTPSLFPSLIKASIINKTVRAYDNIFYLNEVPRWENVRNNYLLCEKGYVFRKEKKSLYIQEIGTQGRLSLQVLTEAFRIRRKESGVQK